jgi:hypothetical protein
MAPAISSINGVGGEGEEGERAPSVSGGEGPQLGHVGSGARAHMPRGQVARAATRRWTAWDARVCAEQGRGRGHGWAPRVRESEGREVRGGRLGLI